MKKQIFKKTFDEFEEELAKLIHQKGIDVIIRASDKNLADRIVSDLKILRLILEQEDLDTGDKK